MTAILVLIGIIILLAVTIYLVITVNRKKVDRLKDELDGANKLNSSLVKQLEQKDKEMKSLEDHYSRMEFTEKELKPIRKKIVEAKTDEEAMGALDSIRKRNSKRVRDN